MFSINRARRAIQGKQQCPPLHLGVVAIKKGAFRSSLTYSANIYIYIYIYIYMLAEYIKLDLKAHTHTHTHTQTHTHTHTHIYIYIYRINLNRESKIFYLSFTITDHQEAFYLSLPPTRHDLTQGQKPEGRLKWIIRKPNLD